MGYTESKYKEVVSELRKLCDRPFVESVEDHFACYWDELGLFIRLHDDALDMDVIALRNSLLNALAEKLPDGNPHFTWQVGFTRRNKTIEVLAPGDEPRDPSDTLRPS